MENVEPVIINAQCEPKNFCEEGIMKHGVINKLLTAAMVVAFVLGMSTAVFAAKVTINDGESSHSTYNAYKVMEATSNSTGDGDKVVYTYTVTDEFKAFFENGANGYTLNKDNEICKDGTAITSDGHVNTNATDAAALASALEKYALEKGISPTTTITANQEKTLDNGLYVVVEKAEANKSVASKPILISMVDKDQTITAKDSKVDLDKEIVENGNDVKKNDVSVGDSITYKVSSNIPTYEANVDKTSLKYTLTDTFSEGLTFTQNSLKVTVIDGEGNEKVITNESGVTITKTANSFEVDLSADEIIKYQGYKVRLDYEAVLNENAKINDTAGNPNDIKLVYTNNPNGDNKYDTLNDETKTYSYEFTIHKVDKNNDTKDLAGASFEIKDSSGKVITIVKYDNDGNPTTTGQGNVTTGKDGTVKVSGLDEGTYTITETKAPDGYSLIGTDIKLTITADKDSSGLPTGKATYEIQGGDNDKAKIETDDQGNITSTVQISDTRGVSMPETGRKAAMYCMIAGAIIIILGGIVLLSPNRKKREDA